MMKITETICLGNICECQTNIGQRQKRSFVCLNIFEINPDDRLVFRFPNPRHWGITKMCPQVDCRWSTVCWVYLYLLILNGLLAVVLCLLTTAAAWPQHKIVEFVRVLSSLLLSLYHPWTGGFRYIPLMLPLLDHFNGTIGDGLLGSRASAGDMMTKQEEFYGEIILWQLG